VTDSTTIILFTFCPSTVIGEGKSHYRLSPAQNYGRTATLRALLIIFFTLSD